VRTVIFFVIIKPVNTRVEVLMVTKLFMLVFCIVTLCGLVCAVHAIISEKDIFSPEDGASMFLQNFGVYPQVNTALLPRRPTLTSLLMILLLTF
jgi:hypothetical protein